MQTTFTRIELKNEAASKLQIKGTGQSLEADYDAILDDKIDPLFLQLMTDGICIVGSDQAIPGEWFNALASLLANVSSLDFGLPYSPDGKRVFENELKRLTSARSSRETLETEYF